MKAYLVQGEGEPRVVEAATFGDAVRLWRAAMIAEFGEGGPEVSGWGEDSEPESVSIVSEEPVIR